MYLQSIQLENYRRFQSAQTDFPDGIVGIIGNNGAGKSTLMEAISWALYGTEAARTGKDEIKRLNAKPQEISRVILDFELQGENYRVVRELKGVSHQQDASVLVSGKVMARGVTAVTDYIKSTLDMDYRDFITSFYAPQKELNVLSDYPPSKRKEILARMLGIEKIDSALKVLRADIRDKDLKLEVTAVHLKDIKELENRKKDLQREFKGYLQKIKDEQEKFQIEESLLKQIENEFRQRKDEFEVFNKLESELSVKNALLTELVTQMTKIKEEIESVDALLLELNKLELDVKSYAKTREDYLAYEGLKLKAEQRKSIKIQIENLLRSMDRDETRIKALELTSANLMENNKTLEGLRNKSLEMEQQLEKIRYEFVKAQSAYKVTIQEQNKVQTQLEGIERLGPDSVCDRCLRPLGEDYPKIKEHLTTELDKLKSDLNSLSEERNSVEVKGKELKGSKKNLEDSIEKLQKEMEQLLREKGEQDALKKELVEKGNNLSFLQENLKSLGEFSYDSEVHLELKTDLERLEKSRDRAIALNQEKNKLPQLKQNQEQLEKNRVNLSSEIETLNHKIKLLSFSEENLGPMEKRVEEKRAEVHQLELRLKDLNHQKGILSLELEKTEKDIQETLKLKEELKLLGEDKLYLEKLDKILVDFRTSLISRIRPALSNYTNELFLELTDGRYEDLELNDDYEIHIFEQGEKFSIERFSGGEKDLANLCLRLAISLLISESSGVEFSFIILDEIFGSQDASRKENILKGLAKLKNRFRQIFLITHIDDIKDSVENLITVLENEDGTSQLILQ
jgi:exonuclease SbcC